MRTPCPPWCTGHEPVAAHRRWLPGDPGLPLIGVIQVTDHPPVLNVGTVAVDLGQAEPMAVLMTQLGRSDIAAAIRQLLAELRSS